MKKFFGYLFLAFGMAFALSYFQNSSVNALDGSYDDAIMGQSSHIDQDENKIELADNKTEYIKISKNQKEEREYKIKILYDKSNKIAVEDILEKIQVKVHTEQEKA